MVSNYYILYYTWDEFTFEDCVTSMRALGCKVDVIAGAVKDYHSDELLISKIKKRCTDAAYDFIFSFNYFPVISQAANDCQIRYLSWVFDSPHLTLDSVTLKNNCNAVFLFDYVLYEKYRNKGISTVYYMPLAYDSLRIEHKIQSILPHYDHEITFLGKLYDDTYNFFDQINYLPPKLTGYIQAIMDSQQLIYGQDLCDLIFTQEKCRELAEYVQIDMGEKFTDYRDELFRNIIRKKITSLERRSILEMLGQNYSVDLYAPNTPIHLPVNYRGYADYINQMPEIFYTSKVNLNITLRSILSGIPLRVIDVLGSHGFLLTNYQQELSEYFINGEDLVWFEDKEDLMDKTNFYLTHDKERQRIAENGNHKVQQNFTYTELLPKIFSIAQI